MRIIDEKIDGSRAVEYIKDAGSNFYFRIADFRYKVGVAVMDEIAEVMFTVNDGDDSSGKYALTNVGMDVATKVFHTVWKILEEVIASNKEIIAVEFTADNSEPSRVKFYKTLAYQLADHYGYDADDVVIAENNFGSSSTSYAVPVG